MLFRLKEGGPHTQGGKTYVKGDLIESDVELDKIFERTRKFERLSSTPDDTATVSPPSKWGSDVTAIVNPLLLKGTLRVYQKGPWFSVVDIETDQELNEKKLKREQLKAFVDQYIDNAESLVDKLHDEAMVGG